MKIFHVVLPQEFDNLKSFYVKDKLLINLNYNESKEGEVIEVNDIKPLLKNSQSVCLYELNNLETASVVRLN